MAASQYDFDERVQVQAGFFFDEQEQTSLLPFLTAVSQPKTKNISIYLALNQKQKIFSSTWPPPLDGLPLSQWLQMLQEFQLCFRL